jgi:urease accessory protein
MHLRLSLDPRPPGPPAAPRLQRADGRAGAVIQAHGGRSVLRDLRQRGCAKAMLPRVSGPPQVVFLNTSGGVTGGDRLRYDLTAGAGTDVIGATQTAERAYRSPGPAGEVDLRLLAHAGARLTWLPQETILFEGSHLRRRTAVDLAADATYLGLEAVILGRGAMGETPARARLDDLRRIHRAGRLIHEEHLVLGPDALADACALGGARALATLVYAAPDAPDRLGPCRAALEGAGCRAAASAWGQGGAARLVARLLGPPAALRRALIRATVALTGRPMPRVWQAEPEPIPAPPGARAATRGPA